MRDELTFALREVRDAARILPACAADLRIRTKNDGSPVTDLDLELDARLVGAIQQVWPEDGIVSEESGAVPGRSGRTWLVDPIDGTSSLVAGGSAWGTHLALADNGEVLLGVISRPLSERMIWAARGHGSWSSSPGQQSPQRMRVSQNQSEIDVRAVGLLDPGRPTAFELERAAKVLLQDDFAVEALADGRADVLLDDAGKAWDQAPAVVIVEEAGGQFTSLKGRHAYDDGYGIYSNGVLHGWARSVARRAGVAC